MKMSSLVIVGAAVVFVGGGCDRINNRYTKEVKTEPAPVVVVVTKESIDLTDAELFLRSRDDVAVGQADVTNQTLFAKTKSGETVEIVKDVHEALEGRLPAAYYLVQEKSIPESNRYTYFIAKELNEKMPPAPAEISRRLYAFDKEAKKFVDTQVTKLTESQMLGPFKYSPDGKKIAVIHRVPEQAEVVYIGDLATGNVTHKYDVVEAHTVVDPNTSGFDALVHPETKWTDDYLFQAVLFRHKQKAKKGKFEPVHVVVISANTQVSVKGRLSNIYVYDPGFDTLYLSNDEAVDMVLMTGVQKQLFGIVGDQGLDESTVYMDVDVGTKKAYLVFRADVSGEELDPVVAVFDKQTGTFLQQSAWPSDINKK